MEVGHSKLKLSTQILIALCFVLVLSVAAFGYVSWQNTLDSNDPSPSPAISNAQSKTPSQTPDPTADWNTFTSKYINLSFKYPSTANYTESDLFRDQNKKDPSGSVKFTGHQVYFQENNRKYLDFDATTSDFTAVDSVAHDFITGTLDSIESFSVNILQKDTVISTEIAPGIFKVTGYGNIECSPFITSYLFVRPPKNSGLKYIGFTLGSDTEEISESDMQEVCEPKKSVITQHVSKLHSSPSIQTSTDLAVAIANTFTVAHKTSGWKTHTSDSYGYSVKYPSDWNLKTGNEASTYGKNSISLTSPETTQKQTSVRAGSNVGMNTSVFADVAITYYASISDTYGGLGGYQPKTLKELSTKLQSPSPTTVAGMKGYEGVALGDAPAFKVILEKNNHIYQISFIGSGHSSKADLTTIERLILESFAFTN